MAAVADFVVDIEEDIEVDLEQDNFDSLETNCSNLRTTSQIHFFSCSFIIRHPIYK